MTTERSASNRKKRVSYTRGKKNEITMSLNKKGGLLFSFCISLAVTTLNGLSQDAPKVYPANWWVGMKNPALQLMIHGKNIGRDTVVHISYPGIRLLKVSRLKNPNYLFLDLV